MDKLRRLFNRSAKKGNEDSPLHKAVREGNVRQVRKLLEKKTDPNVPDKHKMMPLHYAAYWGEDEVVLLLLKYGAKPDCDNGEGWTPLHAAALSGGLRTRKPIIDALVKKGADFDKTDNQGHAAKDYMLLWARNPKEEKEVAEYIEAACNGKNPLPPKRPPQIKPPRH